MEVKNGGNNKNFNNKNNNYRNVLVKFSLHDNNNLCPPRGRLCLDETSCGSGNNASNKTNQASLPKAPFKFKHPDRIDNRII